MFKKLFIVFSVSICFIGASISVNADSQQAKEVEQNSEFSLHDYYLIDRFKNEGMLNDQEIENLVSVSSNVVEIKEGGNSNSRGAISSSKLRIDIAAVKLGYRDMYLKTTFTWLSEPLITYENDAVAFAWANNFTYISYNSTRTYGNGSSVVNGGLAMMNPAPNAGVGFQVPARNSAGTLKSVSVNITLRNETIYNSTNFAAQFAHKTLGFGSLAVGFNASGPTMSWSLPVGTFDVGANMISFSNR